mmetsp:Transcript_17803/g.43555  ORF Transcript_17803/g.43555 Transcript_17803/m.43555 type:complete len:210 (+) Transcript_17803:1086-1715(+)
MRAKRGKTVALWAQSGEPSSLPAARLSPRPMWRQTRRARWRRERQATRGLRRRRQHHSWPLRASAVSRPSILASSALTQSSSPPTSRLRHSTCGGAMGHGRRGREPSWRRCEASMPTLCACKRHGRRPRLRRARRRETRLRSLLQSLATCMSSTADVPSLTVRASSASLAMPSSASSPSLRAPQRSSPPTRGGLLCGQIWRGRGGSSRL